MKTVFTFLFVFVLAWFAFAIYDFNSKDDILIVYQIKEVEDRVSAYSGKKLPKYINDTVSEYRVSQNKVISKVGSVVRDYENCKIFDVDNWECTFYDESANFGATDGIYFSRSNTIKFPHLAQYQEPITVSRFRYAFNNCQWHFLEGVFLGVLGCAITPFIMW